MIRRMIPLRLPASVGLSGLILAFAAFAANCPIASAQENPAASLQARIDSAFATRAALKGPAISVPDAAFARRVAIDLTGMPLSAPRLQAFVDDKTPDKRARLVDELIRSPQATRHLATWLSLTLLERRSPKVGTDDAWMSYLMDIVRNDKPLTGLTRDLLTADGVEGPKHSAGRFLMDRDAEPNLLTRDFSRVFLGRDMQCNQCHDHPLVDGYLQNDYTGLLAFFAPTTVAPVKPGGTGNPVNRLSEKAGGRHYFDSVFVKDDALITGPRLPGHATVAEPATLPGDEYLARQTEAAASVPRVSRRAILAESVIATPEFARNWANRLWGFAMGRGLVHPPDMHHPENPAISPEVLETLVAGLKESEFRIKPVIRAVVLSQAYARPFDLPADAFEPPSPGEAAELKSRADRLKTEQEAAEKLFGQTRAAWHKAQAAMIPVQKKRDPIQAKLDEFGGKFDAARLRLEAIATRRAQIETQKPALTEAKAAADKALAAIAGDKDLTAAAKTFADKITAIDAEKAALIDEQGKKSVDRRAAEEQLAAFRVQAKAVDAELAPLAAALVPLEEAFRTARSRMDGIVEDAARTKAEIRWYELRAKFAETRNRRRTTVETIARVEPDALKAKAESDVSLNQMTAAEKSLASLTARAAELTASAERTRKERDAAAGATAALDRAMAETQTASSLLPAAELAQILSQLQTQKTRVASLADSKKAMTATLEAELAAAAAQMTRTADEKTAIEARHKPIAAKAETLGQELGQLRQRLAEADKTSADLTDEIITAAADRFEIAALKPLSPESLAWSILKTTTVYDRYWATATAELDKAAPPTEAQKADAAWKLNRDHEVEAKVFAQLRSYPQHFASLYGAGAGQPQGDFFASADQALYVANGGAVAGWCMPSAGNPAEAVVKAETPEKAAQALYFGTFGRLPDAEETALVAKALAGAKPEAKPRIARDLFWGLLSSPEFRFNH